MQVSGGNTERIAKQFSKIEITVIDPCIDEDLTLKFAELSNVKVLNGRSLEVLPEISDSFDAILIDGDHNYYTVYRELRLIFENNLLNKNGIILFHDVSDPYARRDLYYEPDIIPENAKLEDAPHGVLTAIEDFLKNHNGYFTWVMWEAEHGLGCFINTDSFYLKYILPFKIAAWKGIRWKNRYS